MLLFSLLNINEMNDQDDLDRKFKSVAASNWLSIIFFASTFVVPIMLTNYFRRNRSRLKDEEFLDKVGKYIEGARTDKYSGFKTIMMLPLTFFIRSIVLTFSIIFMEGFHWGQLASNFTITVALMIWLQHT